MAYLLLRLFGIKPKRAELKAGSVSGSIVPKEFDEKFVWDKKMFKNITYI